jgi:hypothetical protein
MIRALKTRLYTGSRVTTTTTTNHDTPILTEEDTGDLYRALDHDLDARKERVRRIKELVDRGLYRPDLMLVASRILASASPRD